VVMPDGVSGFLFTWGFSVKLLDWPCSSAELEGSLLWGEGDSLSRTGASSSVKLFL
jgi:hypothetical protein